MIDKKEIKNYLGVLVFIVLFFILYRIVDVHLRPILIYFLVPAGLFLAYNAPFSLIFVNAFGLLLLLDTRRNGWWIDTWMLAVMFVALSFIPFYAKKIFVREEKSFDEYKGKLAEDLEGLKAELGELENNSKKLRNEVEKITRLYLLGRELVEQMDMKEIIEHLKISIFDKPEIKSVAIFALDRQNITPIYLSSPDEVSAWNAFVGESQNLINLARSPKMIESALYSDKSVVLWPVKIEEDITSGLTVTFSEEQPKKKPGRPRKP